MIVCEWHRVVAHCGHGLEQSALSTGLDACMLVMLQESIK
jgi:hypothetical protein